MDMQSRSQKCNKDSKNEDLPKPLRYSLVVLYSCFSFCPSSKSGGGEAIKLNGPPQGTRDCGFALHGVVSER